MRLMGSDWPLFGWTTDIRPALATARQEGRSVVLGTLVSVVGPSPRPVGTQMVFDGAQASGYFSGGCLEADVANHAEYVAQDGRPRRLVYGDGSPWLDIRLLCGGSLEILLERVNPDDTAIGDLLAAMLQRSPARLASDGTERQVIGPAPASTAYTIDFDPAWQAIVVGGDPIALAIAGLASTAGFETTIVRPFGPLAPPPLPGLRYVRDALPAAIAQAGVDRWTAIVTATHDDDVDDEVLVTALGTDAAYIGVLGSAGRIASRNARLSEAGIPPTRLAAIHAPIGAARCGKTPWEVAVSVIAEIMQVRNDRRTFDHVTALPAAQASA